MAQASVTRYFHTKKRGIDEDSAIVAKSKVICLERSTSGSFTDLTSSSKKIVHPISEINDNVEATTPKSNTSSKAPVRYDLTSQRVTRSRRKASQDSGDEIQTPKIVNFFKKGNLSPTKKAKMIIRETIKEEPSVPQTPVQESNGMVTPTKQCIPPINPQNSPIIEATKNLKSRLNSMSADEIKKKLKKSTKLTELKTTLNKLQSGLDRMDQLEQKKLQAEEYKMKRLSNQQKPAEASPKSLKTFKNIELEIISPAKQLSSPMKLTTTPVKNHIMSSPKILTPRKLFSPSKSQVISPLKTPAYQKFEHLTKTGTPTLQLPYKYRVLLEIFKATDTICAMFYNRREKITFKKLKPAVQRMLRKNFYETHLAQIEKLFPGSFLYQQEKMRNYGSTSKIDYYQLVITPNTEYKDKTQQTSDNIQLKYCTMSPQMLLDRSYKFQESLLDLVHSEHDKFLESLENPIKVTRKVLKRWHPEFDLEKCPEIELGNLPQPPHVQQYTSAQEVLTAARNLFNCSTPMERALERLESKKLEEKGKQQQNQALNDKVNELQPKVKNESIEESSATTPGSVKVPEAASSTSKKTDALLKGVPKSLLEKIRQKQAAKALDVMLRNPAHEKELFKYKRLPELARYVRNVYITEKKSVLLMEIVLKKIQNSYRGGLTFKEIEEHLRIIAKEMPKWLTFSEIRNEMYIRMARDIEIADVIKQLESIAEDKEKLISK